MPHWDGESTIDVAVLVDIDGTLCSPPRAGKRELRPDAVEALRELAMVSHVVLWSMGGKEVGKRMLDRFPELVPYVSFVGGKGEVPCHLIDLAYSIDDSDVTECVQNGNRVTIRSYERGTDSGLLLEAARKIVDDIRRNAG